MDNRSLLFRQLLVARFESDVMPPMKGLCLLRGVASRYQTELSRIVRRAARAAGMTQQPSMHWLRHTPASHALDRGAPVHVVPV